jgi:transposase
VMDNLSVHHANDVVKLFDENDFVAKFLPTYSCDLNPIEKVWHLLKQRWRRTAHLRLDYGKKEEAIMRDAEDSIRHLCSDFDKELMLKIAKSNFEAMVRSL